MIAFLPYRCASCHGEFTGNVMVSAEADLNEPLVLCGACVAETGERLYEMDETEWWDVCQRVRPDISEPDFARSWQEFQAMKKRSRTVL